MKNRRNVSNKTVAILLALVLAIGCAVGGTLAWLISETKPVVNTFTYGDINIGLEETEREYKITPGVAIDKDPKVTVKANSEACWLFVKIEKSANLDDFISFNVANGWTALEGEDGVYYREVAAVTADTSFYVLADNKVTVKTTVTKQMLDGLTQNTYPTLTFTAYAVQKDNISTAAAAWDLF